MKYECRRVETALFVVVCLLAGAAPGAALVRVVGRRFGGAGTMMAVIIVPPLVALAVDSQTAFLGVWDVLCACLLFSAGFVFATNRRVAPGRRDIALALASASLGLVLLEAGTRLFLPPPPAFPAGPVHLRLSDAIA